MERFPVLGFDYPLPTPGRALRRAHWSTDGLRAMLLPNSGGPSIRVYDPVRDLFTPIVCTGHAGTNVPTEIGLMNFASINGGIDIAADSSTILPTDKVTILLIHRKTDTTVRAGTAFGVDGGVGANRCGAHVPYNDGTIYWDYGGSTDGTTEVRATGLPQSLSPRAWVFTAGPPGMAIYMDGALLNSHSTPAGRSSTTAPFLLNQGNGGGTSDLHEVSFFALLDAVWNEEQVKAWTADPMVMFAPAISRRHFLMAEPPPGVFTVTLDGEDITDAIRVGDDFITPSLDFEKGQPGSFRFDLETPTKPTAGLEVIAWNKTGTVRAFGGVVESAVPIVMPPGVPKCYRVEALKFDRMFDYFYWSRKYEADVTPLQILRDMWADKDLEAEYGLVLDETVAEGDPIVASEASPLEWTNAKGAQVIKDVEGYCGAAGDPRVGVTSPRKKFSLQTPGAVTAPVTIRTTDLNFSDIRVTPTKRPPNTIIGEFGTAGEGANYITHPWTVAPGQTVFQLEGYNIPASSGSPGVINVNGADEPMSEPDTAGPNDIVWDHTLNGGTATFQGTSAALLSTGYIVSVHYQPKFPFTVTRGSGTPRIEALIKDAKVEHYNQGVLAADAALATQGNAPNIFEIDTLEDGLDMYQLLPFDVPEADAEDTEGIITALRATLHTADPDNPAEGSFWEYTVTVEETGGNPLQVDPNTRHRLALRSVL